MKILIMFLLGAIVLGGCQSKNTIYSKNKELSPQVEWLRKDSRSFSVPIEDIQPHYRLFLTFRYAEGYAHKILKVKIKETAPSGKEVEREYEVTIVDENGEYVGEPGYTIWDSEHKIEDDFTFEEKGTYTYTITQDMPVDPLNNALEIGMMVEKK